MRRNPLPARGSARLRFQTLMGEWSAHLARVRRAARGRPGWKLSSGEAACCACCSCPWQMRVGGMGGREGGGAGVGSGRQPERQAKQQRLDRRVRSSATRAHPRAPRAAHTAPTTAKRSHGGWPGAACCALSRARTSARRSLLTYLAGTLAQHAVCLARRSHGAFEGLDVASGRLYKERCSLSCSSFLTDLNKVGSPSPAVEPHLGNPLHSPFNAPHHRSWTTPPSMTSTFRTLEHPLPRPLRALGRPPLASRSGPFPSPEPEDIVGEHSS